MEGTGPHAREFSVFALFEGGNVSERIYWKDPVSNGKQGKIVEISPTRSAFFLTKLRRFTIAVRISEKVKKEKNGSYAKLPGICLTKMLGIFFLSYKLF